MDPLPYNITIPSQTSSIIYNPSGPAGAASSGWNIQYSGGSNQTKFGYSQGVGTDIRQTTVDGASLQLNWVGTAAYLYGQASGASYTIDVDGAPFTTSSTTVPQGGLLGSHTGLVYGNHTVTFTVHGKNPVAFQYAELTTGAGYPGITPQNRTILAVQPDNTTANPFFTYVGIQGPNSWRVENIFPTTLLPNGSVISDPIQMVTNTAGESVSFTLSNTTAFFLRGALNNDHGPKTVTITPNSNPAQARNASFNDASSVLEFNQIVYWESGLDRDENYTVLVTDAGITGSTSFSISSLDIIDGGSAPSSSSENGTLKGSAGSGGQNVDPIPATKLGTGAIAGIAVAGAVVLLLLLLGAFLLWRRRARGPKSGRFQKTPILPEEYSGNSLLGTSNSNMQLTPQFTGASTVSLVTHARETDGGPVPLGSPPQYENRWAPQDPSLTVAVASPLSGSNNPASPTAWTGDEKRRQLFVLTYEDDAAGSTV